MQTNYTKNDMKYFTQLFIFPIDCVCWWLEHANVGAVWSPATGRVAAPVAGSLDLVWLEGRCTSQTDRHTAHLGHGTTWYVEQTCLQSGEYKMVLSGECKMVLSGECKMVLSGECKMVLSGECKMVLSGECKMVLSGECKMVLSGKCKMVLSGACKMVLSGECKMVLSGECKMVLSGECKMYICTS